MSTTRVDHGLALWASAVFPSLGVLGCSRAPVTADFALTLEVRTGSLTTTHILLYQRPHKWLAHSIQQVANLSVTTTAVCDGSTLWVQSTPGDECHRWNVDALVREFGEEEAFTLLRAFSMITFLPANPKAEPWSTEFGGVDWNEVGEEEHAGIPTVLLEVGNETKIRAWFAKSDGLLREQIMYKPGGEEWIRFTVIDVAVARKVPSNRFTFVPEKGTKVIDETEDTLRADRKKGND